MPRRPKLVHSNDREQIDQVAEIAQWRGKIDEQMANVVKSLDRLHEDFKQQTEEASKHQVGLMQVISALSTSVQGLSDNVKEMRPIVTVLEANRLRAQGVVWGLRALWILIGGMVGAGVATFIRH